MYAYFRIKIHLYSFINGLLFFFFFSSRRRHTRYWRDWSSDVCSSDLGALLVELGILDEANLAAALAEQLSLPLIDLSDQVPEPDALKMLPETVARSEERRVGKECRYWWSPYQ